MHFFCFALMLCSICLSANDEVDTSWPNVRFKNPLIGQDLSLGIVRALYQDRQGFIWIGSESGLIRYDAYELVSYQYDINDPSSISFDMIWDITENNLGELWVATERGLNRFDPVANRFTRYRPDPDSPSSLGADAVRHIQAADGGDLWLSTFGGGINYYDRQSDSFRSFRHNPKQIGSVSSDYVFTTYIDKLGRAWFGTKRGINLYDAQTQTFTQFRAESSGKINEGLKLVRKMFEDSRGNFWVGTDEGLALLDQEKGSYSPFMPTRRGISKLGRHSVWDIHEDKNGLLWIATDSGGVILLNPEKGHFKRFTQKVDDTNSISSNVVRTLIEDSLGDLWFGMFPTGINLVDRSADAIAIFKADPEEPGRLNHNSVLSVLEEENGNLWLGTDGGGLNYYDRESGRFTAYMYDPDDPTSISSNAVLSLTRDAQGYIWASTWGGGVNRFDPKTRTFKRYLPDTQDKTSISNPHVWTGIFDSRGDLWFGTIKGGLNRYDPKNDNFIRYRHDKNDPTSIMDDLLWSFYEDRQGNFWVGTNAGLDLFNRDTGTFTHYRIDHTDPISFENSIWSLYEDSQGQFWVGTRAGLYLLDRATGIFTSIRKKDGLANEDIRSIIEDPLGYLWLGTNKNLSRISLKDWHIENFNRGHWLQGGFKNNAVALLASGELIFGSADGFTLFRPEDVQVNTHLPPLILSRLDIFNKPVTIGSPNSPLSKPIGATDSLTFTYKQSVFSFNYAALSYRNPGKNQYAYMLEGFDKEWNNVGTQRRATYTNLDAGDYVFHVKGSNDEGFWNEEGVSLAIKILPPPWLTWWAYTLYVLAFFTLIFWFISSQRKKVAEQKSINRRLRYLDKLKDDLLANTSHELRTPLNGIIGLSESLIDGVTGPLGEVTIENLRMISNSGKRLASLVNDILDFSKLKSKKLRIDKKAVDVRSLVEVVSTLSQPLIGNKDLAIINAIEHGLPAVSADENRLQQILFNLLGNAIKFTEAGSITITAEVDGEVLWVRIKDTGIGIAADGFDKIFESFEQIEDHESRKFSGTGLGLAVTKQLVELHDGQITVDSKVGEGSIFSFYLPLSKEPAVNLLAPQDECVTKLKDTEAWMDEDKDDPSITNEIKIEQNNIRHKHEISSRDLKRNADFRILIVDDEPINRQVLVNQLSLQNYQITEADSGLEALDIINQHGPFDLILLDIMMPRMSGYEVCNVCANVFLCTSYLLFFLQRKILFLI